MNKFRKQLKKYGMETEFKNWMTNLEKTWSVGSRVELIENLPFSGFKEGDVGTVVGLLLNAPTKGVRVEFDLEPDKELYLYTRRMRLI